MLDKVKQVNDLLLKGEPGNVSEDTYSHYTGYKPQAIIDAMNEAFGVGEWGFKELSSETAPTKDGGGLAISQVEVWLKGIEFRPSGWGQGRITKSDLGDARKSAQTDAIKKALSYFSIGNRAYHGLLDKHKAPPVAGNGATSNRTQEAKKEVGEQKGRSTTVQTTRPVTSGATNHTTNPVTSNETAPAQENKKAPPTVRELQDRCNKIWGVGFFQTMLQKSAKTTETVIVKELTDEARWQASAYMDKAEAMKSSGK